MKHDRMLVGRTTHGIGGNFVQDRNTKLVPARLRCEVVVVKQLSPGVSVKGRQSRPSSAGPARRKTLAGNRQKETISLPTASSFRIDLRFLATKFASHLQCLLKNED